MEYLQKLIFLTFVLTIGSFGYIHTENNRDLADVEVKSDFRKRGIIGMIAKAVFLTVPVASTGVSLAVAISGGCIYYKSICADKKEIRQLEDKISELSKTYEKIYFENRHTYLEILESQLNNKFIMLYINQVLHEVDHQGYLIGNISSNIKLDKNDMVKYLKFYKGTEALKNMFLPYEYALNQIKSIITHYNRSPVIALTVQRVAETLLGSATNYVAHAMNTSGHFTKNNTSFFDYLGKDSSPDISVDYEYWDQIKGMFETTAESLGEDITEIVKSVQIGHQKVNSGTMNKWLKARNKWKAVKIVTKNFIKKTKTSFQKVKGFLNKPVTKLKYKAKSFKFMTSVNFVSAIALVADILQQYATSKDWKEVADTLAATRLKYEKYKTKLDKEILRLKKESENFTSVLNKEISSFKELVKNIKKIMSFRRNSIFAKQFGLTKSSVDKTDAFYQTNFDSIDVKSLKKRQTISQVFMIKMKDILKNLTAEFKSLEILLTESKSETKQDKDIGFIFKSLKRIYNNIDSPLLKNFGTDLQEKDILCAIAMTSPDQSQYDFFPLAEFRSKQCKFSEAEYSLMRKNAHKKSASKLLYKAVQMYVNKDKDISAILFLAQQLYKNERSNGLKVYGENLTLRNIVCAIATLYPTLDSYDSYDLSRFRPDCSKVTENMFQIMKVRSDKLKKGKATIKYLVESCFKGEICVCPSRMAKDVGLSIKETEKIISEFRPRIGCVYVEVMKKCKWKCQR